MNPGVSLGNMFAHISMKVIKMVSELAKKIFPQYAERIENGKCPFCNEPIGEFRDEVSRKEFKISGLCQKCQDGTFGD